MDGDWDDWGGGVAVARGAAEGAAGLLGVGPSMLSSGWTQLLALGAGAAGAGAGAGGVTRWPVGSHWPGWASS